METVTDLLGACRPLSVKGSGALIQKEEVEE